jgi:hypothetical protein
MALDHSEVESLFGDEIHHLSVTCSNFYHGGLKQIIKLKLDLIMICVDLLERTSMF